MAERLKEMFFTQASLGALAKAIQAASGEFDQKRFLRLASRDAFKGLELKQMMRHTTGCLRQTLPESYARAVRILMRAAPEVRGFEAMCLPDYVELYGGDDWELSLKALAVFTKYSSSEFAIRPFLQRDPSRAMAFMMKLARDQDPKVRRFASEGCRPRLPWAMALPAFKADPTPILPILERLRDDDSESVRNSVANSLNDISKDHPNLVLDLAERWLGKSDRTDRVLKHACRTLLKAGNPRAMALFGFGKVKGLAVVDLRLEKKTVGIGDSLTFTFSVKLRAQQPSSLRIEYAVYFAKSSGKVGKKVFKITERVFGPGTHPLRKRHFFVDMSTRKHHPGEHSIAILINGQEQARASFQLRGAETTR